MDITFNCDKCSQHIAMDEAGAGQLVDCPKCGSPIEVPYKSKSAATAAIPASRPVSTPPPDKKCPSCAEMVKAEAKICRFCSYDFATGQRPVKSAATTSNGASSFPKKILTRLVIIVVIIGGCFACKFWLYPTVEGDVFIVTRGGNSIKLGLATIEIKEHDDLKKCLAKLKTTAVEDEKKNRSWYYQGGREENIDSIFWGFVCPYRYSTKTDADGHFSMPISGFGRSILVAKATRDVGNEVEHFYWILPLPPSHFGKINVTLSNNNLTSPAKMVDFDFTELE